MRSFLGCLLGAILAFTLAVLLVPGVQITGNLYSAIKIIFIAGVILGVLNLLVAPLLRFIVSPIKWLFLGLFGLFAEIIFIELIDIVFTPEIAIQGVLPLFWTGLLVWVSVAILARSKVRS